MSIPEKVKENSIGFPVTIPEGAVGKIFSTQSAGFGLFVQDLLRVGRPTFAGELSFRDFLVGNFPDRSIVETLENLTSKGKPEKEEFLPLIRQWLKKGLQQLESLSDPEIDNLISPWYSPWNQNFHGPADALMGINENFVNYRFFPDGLPMRRISLMIYSELKFSYDANTKSLITRTITKHLVKLGDTPAIIWPLSETIIDAAKTKSETQEDFFDYEISNITCNKASIADIISNPKKFDDAQKREILLSLLDAVNNGTLIKITVENSGEISTPLNKEEAINFFKETLNKIESNEKIKLRFLDYINISNKEISKTYDHKNHEILFKEFNEGAKNKELTNKHNFKNYFDIVFHADKYPHGKTANALNQMH